MGNKLNFANREDKEDNESKVTLDSLPGLVCTTDNLPVSVIDDQKSEILSNTRQFEEYFERIIKQCISSNAKEMSLIPGNVSKFRMALFKFPYTLFNQCSSNLVDLTIVWYALPSQNDSAHSNSDPSTVINSFPSDIFDNLPNLTQLNLARYPFPYLSDKIGNLSKLQRLSCYGSKIMCFPRTMYKLTKLTMFDPYTSYELHYLPYEMKDCSLNDTRISTGALYNNYKNKQLFPPLPPYPNTFVHEIGEFIFNEKQLKTYVFGKHCALSDNLNDLVFAFAFNGCTFCSKCKCDIMNQYIHYIWVFETIGTDGVGLLGRMCPNCIEKYVESKDFIANNKKCDFVDEGNHWGPRIDWSEDVDYEKELFLFNKKGTTTSAKMKYVYEIHEKEFYKIPKMHVSWKYTGFDSNDYNMDNVSASWIKFWKFNLFIDFEKYKLCTN